MSEEEMRKLKPGTRIKALNLLTLKIEDDLVVDHHCDSPFWTHHLIVRDQYGHASMMSYSCADAIELA
jgi:hypothetical protein